MGSLKPAAIQFMLECLQESARQSGIFFLLYSCIFIHRILESDLLSVSTCNGATWILFVIMMEVIGKDRACVPEGLTKA